jgi:spermidine synthase
MLRRYGGDLIFHRRDNEGVLEVVDTHGVRALHFGTSPRQSAMSLKQPERVELAYVRAMLSPLLFMDEPQNVLLVGLGGGSLAKFLLDKFRCCQVQAIERRAGVVDVAHEYFGLPCDERLTVQIADASLQVLEMAQNETLGFDLVLVDAYDHLGMDASVNATGFFSACARLLRPQGVLAMNLWGTHPVSLKQSIALLKSSFPGRAMRLAVPNRGNVIGLGLGEAVDTFNEKLLLPHARRLEVLTGLEMAYFLRNLRTL